MLLLTHQTAVNTEPGDATMTTIYCAEMNEARPANTQIDATIGHYGSYYLKTPLVLKGRGITFRGTLTSEQLTPQAQDKVGWHQYKVTDLAFAKLEAQYAISIESLL